MSLVTAYNGTLIRVYHLGNWGPESSGGSSCNNIHFRIGKYTELVMKDAGFESTVSLHQQQN